MRIEIPEAEQALITRTAQSFATAGATLSGADRQAEAIAVRASAANPDPSQPSSGDPMTRLV